MNEEKKRHIIRATMMGTLGGLMACVGVIVAGFFLTRMISSTKPEMKVADTVEAVVKFALFGAGCGLAVGLLSKPPQPKQRKTAQVDDFESEVRRKVQKMIDEEQGKAGSAPAADDAPSDPPRSSADSA